MKWSVCLPLILTGLTASAKPEAAQVKERDLLFPSDTIDLTQKAREESAAPGVQQQKASEAQIGSDSGIFVLKDPGLTPVISPWIFLIDLRAQRLAPAGTAEMGNGQTFDLGGASARTYPIIDVGVKRVVYASDRQIWYAALRGEAGYSSQSTTVYFPAGAQAPDTKLATSLLGGTLFASARFIQLPSILKDFEWEAGYSRGIVTFTQSSTNDAANFSTATHYHGFLLGAYYWPLRSLGIGLEYARRDMDDHNGVQIPSDNASLGMRVEW